MAEFRKDEVEHLLLAKRKPDPNPAGEGIAEKGVDNSTKRPKLESSPSEVDFSVFDEEKVDDGAQNSHLSIEDEEDGLDEEEEEDYHAEDEDEDDYEEDEDEDECSHADAEIDRKGEGVMRDDKGKGKLIEESDSESGSNAFESDTDTDGDSDLSDDPLAEVDLDNILPSRTRRCPVRPGVYISNAAGKAKHGGSDDCDA